MADTLNPQSSTGRVPSRPAWLEIDYEAYRHNLRALAAHTGTPVLAVIKANAYGHGLLEMGKHALLAGCPGVGVAIAEEGALLRLAGQTGRIVVLGVSSAEQWKLCREHDLELVVGAEEQSVHWLMSEEPPFFHLKVDTGMSRVGIEPGEALEIARSRRKNLVGVMTHFACADEPERPETREQLARFVPVVQAFRKWEQPPLFHAANSAAALWFPETRLDWVRGGLVTYGVNPTPLRQMPFDLRPVTSLKARIMQLKTIPAGRSVSYGGTWTASRPTRLALVTLGYADGYPWALANKGEALHRGTRVPIRGRVCMDQMLLDVTDTGAEEGEVVVLLGRQGMEEITAQELADRAGTIPYEILTSLSTRLPRVPAPVTG